MSEDKAKPDFPTPPSLSSEQEIKPEPPTPTPTPIPMPTSPELERLTFIKTKKRRYAPSPNPNKNLRNSLLAGVGFLELANAGDFAANVWNTVPPPHFAMGLMAVGGTLALSITYFAFQDLRLSWRNVKLLREERRYLRTLRRRGHDTEENGVAMECELDCLLDVNFRELGTEAVDRVAMDSLMGFGAILVGVGTFMAIGGANPQVYHASNLLSGYIGNTPGSLYGVANFVWSIYTWRRARRHGQARIKKSGLGDEDTAVDEKLKSRTDIVKTHAVVNGLTGLVGAIGSLISATMWWGYIILLPCIFSAIHCNFVWRQRILYDRPSLKRLQTQLGGIDKDTLIRELKLASSTQETLKGGSSQSTDGGISGGSLASTLAFIVEYGIFEELCMKLLNTDPALTAALFGPSSDRKELTIDSRSLLGVDVALQPRILEIARRCVRDVGSMRLVYRERYLLEILGCYMCVAPEMATVAEKEEKS